MSSNEAIYRFSPSYLGGVYYSRPYLNDGATNTIGYYLPGLYGLRQEYSSVGVPDIVSAPATIVPKSVDDKMFVRFNSFTCSSGDQYSEQSVVIDVGGGFRP